MTSRILLTAAGLFLMVLSFGFITGWMLRGFDLEFRYFCFAASLAGGIALLLAAMGLFRGAAPRAQWPRRDFDDDADDPPDRPGNSAIKELK